MKNPHSAAMRPDNPVKVESPGIKEPSGWPAKFNYARRSTNFMNSRGVDKVKKSMEEFKAGELHSGSKSGPKVTNRKQAIAIGLSEERKQKAGGYR